MGKHQDLASFDMSPGCFLFKEISIQDFAAKIVQGDEKSSSVLGIRRLAMVGSIVLD